MSLLAEEAKSSLKEANIFLEKTDVKLLKERNVAKGRSFSLPLHLFHLRFVVVQPFSFSIAP